jgi:hypothetical protein
MGFQNIQEKAPASIYFLMGKTSIKLDSIWRRRWEDQERKKQDKSNWTWEIFYSLTLQHADTGLSAVNPDLNVPVPDQVNIILSEYPEVVELLRTGF